MSFRTTIVNDIDYFGVELIRAINEWMLSPSPDIAEKIRSLSSNLPSIYRTRSGPVFRRIDLTKGFVWDLMADERLLEKISSWTLKKSIAEDLNKGVPPIGVQGVIFMIPEDKGTTILNFSNLFNLNGFGAACEKFRDQIPNIEYGIDCFKNDEQEVLIDVEDLYPEEIVSFGGYSSTSNELVSEAGLRKYGREPTKEERKVLEAALSGSGHKVGARWLREDQVANIREKLVPKIALLRQAKTK